MTAPSLLRLREERRTGRPPLVSAATEERMRRAAADGLSQRTLAERFGVSVSTVQRVLRGKA